LLQFRSCSVPNGGPDAQLIEQFETGCREALSADLLSRIRAFLNENHAPSSQSEQYRCRCTGRPGANDQDIGIDAVTHGLPAHRFAPQ
jgi:hypothetical protein